MHTSAEVASHKYLALLKTMKTLKNVFQNYIFGSCTFFQINPAAEMYDR